MKKKRVHRICLYTIIWFVMVMFTSSTIIDEYAVKSASIYNFTKFIEWPKECSSSEFVICTNDKEKAYPYLLQATRSKFKSNKKIVIKLCSIDKMEPCDILFLHKNTPVKDVKKFIRSTLYDNTLVITEHRNGLELGAIINFIEYKNKIKFEYNLRTANDKSFKTSSNLLKVAINVVSE